MEFQYPLNITVNRWYKNKLLIQGVAAEPIILITNTAHSYRESDLKLGRYNDNIS